MSKRILFVCTENAGRSQIAEAFLRKYAPEYEVYSAGITPASEIHPLVVQVMNEIGIDITIQKPKLLDDSMVVNSSKTINMGCMKDDSHPTLFENGIINWNISDPKNKDIEEVRKIRDKIKSDVLQLIDSLKAES